MRRSLLKALQGAAPAWSQASSSKQQCNQAALTAFSAVHLPFQRVDEQQEATAQHHQLRLLHASPSPSHSFPLLLTQRPGMASFLPSVAGVYLCIIGLIGGDACSTLSQCMLDPCTRHASNRGIVCVPMRCSNALISVKAVRDDLRLKSS